MRIETDEFFDKALENIQSVISRRDKMHALRSCVALMKIALEFIDDEGFITVFHPEDGSLIRIKIK